MAMHCKLDEQPKCLPVLMYDVDACPVNKSVLRSLDFCLNCTLMKIFKTKSMEVVRECQRMFNLSPMDSAVRHRKLKFLRKFICVDNPVCKMFRYNIVTKSAIYLPN